MKDMGIFSKTSLVSSSSIKSMSPSEEILKLQSEIETLRQTIGALTLTIESRDAAIGTLAREKEKLYVELKTVQRTNRNLHQQLEDERNMHSKQKDFLIQEIKRLSNSNENLQSKNENDTSAAFDIISLLHELRTKDEIIYNVCTKFMKLKASKMMLCEELKKLQCENQKAFEEVISILQKNNFFLDELFRKLIEHCQVPPKSEDFLKLLRSNALLHFDNTQLRVCITSPTFKTSVSKFHSFLRENQFETNFNKS